MTELVLILICVDSIDTYFHVTSDYGKIEYGKMKMETLLTYQVFYSIIVPILHKKHISLRRLPDPL